MKVFFLPVFLFAFLIFSTFGLPKQDLNLDYSTQTNAVEELKKSFVKGLYQYLHTKKEPKVVFHVPNEDEFLSGKLQKLEIFFENCAFDGIEKLDVNEGRVFAKNLLFDSVALKSKNKLFITSMEDVSFHLKVSEENINSFLALSEKQLKLKQPKLELLDNKMIFSAKVRTRFFSSQIRTEGRFEVNPKVNTVDFRTSHVALNGMKIPRFLLGNITSRINPVLKLNRFPLMHLIPLKLEKIEIQNGFISFLG